MSSLSLIVSEICTLVRLLIDGCCCASMKIQYREILHFLQVGNEEQCIYDVRNWYIGYYSFQNPQDKNWSRLIVTWWVRWFNYGTRWHEKRERKKISASWIGRPKFSFRLIEWVKIGRHPPGGDKINCGLEVYHVGWEFRGPVSWTSNVTLVSLVPCTTICKIVK